MSIINYASREIQFKIVYYGPALCGKTTNLAYIHQRINPGESRRSRFPRHGGRSHPVFRFSAGQRRRH